jgi:hypothetical protein
MAIAMAGLLALATAMGIGRFAFTPLLPMMLHDGVVDLPGASWLATANYLGYWLGALGCALQPALWRRRGLAPPLHTRLVRAGLVATVLFTLCIALPWPATWPLWRALAGVASAVVFVYVSGWCLARLAALGQPRLAGLIFVGPGLGIAVSGFAATAMVAHGLRAVTGWALVRAAGAGADGTGLAAVAGQGEARRPTFVRQALSITRLQQRGRVCAGLRAGGLRLHHHGHIPAGHRAAGAAGLAVAGPVLADLRHRRGGGRAAHGAAARALGPPPPADGLLRHAGHRRYCWGCGCPSLAGFALGSLLLGLPFTAITLFAMQEARRLWPHNTSALIGPADGRLWARARSLGRRWWPGCCSTAPMRHRALRGRCRRRPRRWCWAC